MEATAAAAGDALAAAARAIGRASSMPLRIVRVARRPLSTPLFWPGCQSIPAGGLDVIRAQSMLFWLRKSLPAQQQGPDLVDVWLAALQLAQISSDRLLHAMSATQRSLGFWRGRLQESGHSSFMLLARGPGSFFSDCLSALKLSARCGEPDLTPSDHIAERIATLQLLLDQLAEALAEVHRAAAVLDLARVMQGAAPGSVGRQPDLNSAVAAAVSDCLAVLVTALQKLLPQVARMQQHDMAARQLPRAARACQPVGGGSSSSHGITMKQLQQQVADVWGLLGIQGNQAQLGQSDARTALAGASRLAAQLGPLVRVPAWAHMPSSLQRHWIKYSIAAGLGVSAAAFLYRHSRLAGSRDLDDWASAALTGVRSAWADHVVSPLVMVRDELFKTFRDRPSIVSSAEFEADKQSLLRMLEAFQRDHPAAAAAVAVAAADTPDSSTGNAAVPAVPPLSALEEADAVNRGMQVVMRRYEADLEQPIRNLLAGELGRTLLIQVQRMKLDGLGAMLEMDQVLRANELSISLVAAVPALLVSWALLRGLWVLLSPSPPDPVREAMPCRMAMGELERALAALAALQQQQQQEQPGGATPVVSAEGLVLFRVSQVLGEAAVVYRLKDRSSRFSEWPHLKGDLLELAQPATSGATKLDLVRRMLRMYSLLQP